MSSSESNPIFSEATNDEHFAVDVLPQEQSDERDSDADREISTRMNDSPQQTTVLLVGDLPTSLDVLAGALSRVDYRVLVAESGQSALQVLRQAAQQQSLPQIILLDVMMPGMDGFETCRQIKTEPLLAEIPVIFVTSHNESVQKIRGFDVGGVDYITKPIDLAEVQARINVHLTIRRLQEQLQAENNALLQKLQEHIVQLEVAIQARDLATQEISHLRDERDKLLNLGSNHQVHLSQTSTLVVKLSEREREVLALIARSKDDVEIAARLFVAESTVRTYRSRIMNKLEAKNPYALMQIALRHFGDYSPGNQRRRT